MRTFFVCLSLIILSGCAKNPVSGQNDFVLMSESQEIAIGRQSDVQVRKQYKVYESEALQDYVDGVGQKVARSSHRPRRRHQPVPSPRAPPAWIGRMG